MEKNLCGYEANLARIQLAVWKEQSSPVGGSHISIKMNLLTLLQRSCKVEMPNGKDERDRAFP